MAEFMKPKRLKTGLGSVFLIKPTNRRLPQSGRPKGTGKEPPGLPVLQQRLNGIDHRKNTNRPSGFGSGEDLLLRSRLNADDPGNPETPVLEIGPLQSQAFGNPKPVIDEQREKKLVPRILDNGKKPLLLVKRPNGIHMRLGIIGRILE
jgi:hypothetical protein